MTRNFAAKAVHKYMYPATYNFRDDANGDLPSGWTQTTATGVVAASFASHKKVLKCTSTGGGSVYRIYQQFTAQADGDIEFWIGSTDATNQHTFYFGKTTSLAVANIATYIYILNDILYGIKGDGAGGATSVNMGAITDNTIAHVRIHFDTTTDKVSIWRDGTNYIDVQNFFNDNVFAADELNTITLLGPNVAGAIGYFDAIGFSWDTDYAIGDNCFWRHYGESTDDFESDDVGTQGTSITWGDGVDTAASWEIIAEFNEHKKVLRGYYSSGVGGNDLLTHSFATQAKTGFYEFWIKSSDVTDRTLIRLRDGATVIIDFQITTDKFQIYTGGAYRDVTGAPVPVDDIWYHIYVQWYDAATDNFDLFIDNIQYEDGTACVNNQTSGITINLLYVFGAASYFYMDAPISSLDSDSRADNRIFDYNDAYTREDITTTTQNVFYSNILHQWRTATLLSNQDYEQTVLFFQIYDINSKLSMEAEISNRIQNGQTRVYTLLDKNQDDLLNLSSNTFDADDIHDPTDSTCMLKTVLPNVSEADGDLILVNADTKTDTYSTVTKNYPDGQFLTDISDLSDSVVIIEGNGKCHLDDDLASGDSLDFDTAADHSKMLGDPIVNDILDTINYFEVFGAINPGTGERFYKITDNSGTDRKRKWRIINNSYENQTDLDAYAIKLVAKLVSVKEITISVQGLGAHDMGTTFTYKFDNDVYTIPSAAYYIIKETMDFDTAAATIVLSEGLVEVSKYAAGHEKMQNYSDTYASQIYETDYIIVYPYWIENQLTQGAGYWWGNNFTDGILWSFVTPNELDETRGIEMVIGYRRHDANADTVTVSRSLQYVELDGTEGVFTSIWAAVADTLPAEANLKFNKKVLTIPAADVYNNKLYFCNFLLQEARTIDFYTLYIKFYIKRNL